MNNKQSSKTSNIINFEQSADFFYRLGLEKRKRDDLVSALSYQRRALELENRESIRLEIADILSEMNYPHESTVHLLRAFPDPDTRPFEAAAMICDNFIVQGENLQAAVSSLRHNKGKTAPESFFDSERIYSFMALVGAFDLSTFLPRHESIDADVPEYVEQRIQGLIMQGEYEIAASACERFLNAFPAALNIVQDLIYIYMILGDEEKAEPLFERFLKYDVKNPNYATVCSVIMATTRDSDKDYAPLIVDIAEDTPSAPFEMYLFVNTAMMLGYPEYTGQHIKRLLKLYPYSKNLLHKNAVYLSSCGEYKQAAAQYDKILKIFPNNFLAIEFKRRCLAAADNPEIKPHLPVRFIPCDGMRITAEDVKYDQRHAVAHITEKSLLDILKIYPELFPDKEERENMLREFLLAYTVPYRAKTAALRQLIDMHAKPPYAVALEASIVEGSPSDFHRLNDLPDALRDAAEESIKIIKRSYRSICAMVAFDLWEYYGACMQYLDYDAEGMEEALTAAISYKAIIRCEPRCDEQTICEKFSVTRNQLIHGIGLLNDIEALGED